MPFRFFTTLSLVLHLLLLGLLWVWRADVGALTETQPVQIVYRDTKPDKSSEKTFIRDLEVPDNLKFEDPVETQFASKERNRVLLETRARETGITKNRRQGPRFLMEEQKPWDRQLDRQKAVDEDGFHVFNPKQEMQDFDTGESTISVRLPDSIAVGSFTALNTDRHLYYSFYARLEDMIYLRWADLIKRAIDSYPLDFRRRKLAGRSHRTDLVVLLKPNGEFHRAEIHTASGVERFDISPALAFQDARIFPNPPPEMIREDGFIHISYSFVVDFGRVQ